MLQNPFTQMPEAPSIDDKPVSRASNAGKTSPAEQGLEIPMGWKPTPKEPVPVVRCTGTATTTGERCKRWSLRGATVCRKHGAQLSNVREHAEAVVESAKLQLMGMADDAVDVLDDILQNGTSEQVRLKAVEMVLNRSGIKDAVDLNVQVTHNVSAAEEIRKKLSAITERMKADEPEDIIDAEEVDDEEKEL
jgi:uncharacterized coiled-coil protein SlyX